MCAVLVLQNDCTHSLVVGVNEDHFVVLVDTVLVHPVGVEDPKVTAATTNTLLCGALETTLGLEVVHTLTDGLAVGRACLSGVNIFHRLQLLFDAELTLGRLLLAVAPADTDAVDDIALLGLVAETAGLVGAGRARCTVDNIELAVLPSPVILSDQ
jgi:hypothetical protein